MQALFYLFLLLFSACGSSVKPETGLPLVLVTVAPYAYFVEAIARDTVETQVLVPPGVNVHVFEPTPKELVQASHAKLWLRLGEVFEKKIYSSLHDKDPSLKVLELWKLVPLEAPAHSACKEHPSEEARDLHYWLSPKLAALQCRAIAKALIELFPEHRATYEAGLEKLEDELHQLDEQLASQLAPFKGSILLVSHPALGYFCQEYGLEQLSIECSGKDPLPQDVDRIMNQAKNSQVKVVFAVEGYSTKGAQLIADKLHLPIYSIDPYSKAYVSTLLELANRITQ